MTQAIQTTETADKEIDSFVQDVIKKPGHAIPSSEDPKVVGQFFQDAITQKEGQIKGAIEGLATLPKGDDFTKSISALQQQVANTIRDISRYSDLHCGIITSDQNPGIAFNGNNPADKSPVKLRDSRFQSAFADKKAKPEDVPEQTVAMAASNLQGCLQIIKDSPAGDKSKAAELALKVFQDYSKRINPSAEDGKPPLSQDERAVLVKKMNGKLVEILKHKDFGISIGTTDKPKPLSKMSDEKVLKGMGLVRDLAQVKFGTHASEITISSPIRQGQSYGVEAVIPLTSMSDTTKKRYEESERSKWTKAMPAMLRHSLEHSSDGFCTEMTSGKKIISSQLKVPGLTNPYQHYVKIVKKDNAEVESSMSVKRCAAVAHEEGKASGVIKKIKNFGNKAARKLNAEMTSENIDHLSALSGGKSVDNVLLIQRKQLKEFIGKGIDDAKALLKSRSKTGDKAGPGYSDIHLPISVSLKKASHLRKICDVYNKATEEGREAVFSCAKGKDRTSAALNMIIDDFLKKHGCSQQDFGKMLQTHVGDSLSENVTAGAKGTKASNVLSGLEKLGGKDNPLLEHKAILKGKLPDLNHVKALEDKEYDLGLSPKKPNVSMKDKIARKMEDIKAALTSPKTQSAAVPSAGQSQSLRKETTASKAII